MKGNCLAMKKEFRICWESQKSPEPSEAVKKFSGGEIGERYPCPGDAKNLQAKRGTDSFLARGVLNLWNSKWKPIVFNRA